MKGIPPRSQEAGVPAQLLPQELCGGAGVFPTLVLEQQDPSNSQGPRTWDWNSLGSNPRFPSTSRVALVCPFPRPSLSSSSASEHTIQAWLMGLLGGLSELIQARPLEEGLVLSSTQYT